MPVSRLDVIYRKLLLSKFFTKGWGLPGHLERLFQFRKIISNRQTCCDLVPKDYPIQIINSQKYVDCHIIEGKFRSPFALHLEGLVPTEVQDAYFQMVLPLRWKNEHKPICIHLAGTGDHYFWRRRNIMAKPLLKAGIGAIILENPFYGLRKPKKQIRSSVHYVSDIFVMGGCLILECLVLLHWCEQLGFGPLGITGISMGGHMASLAATNWPKPLVLVPCLSWSTASSVFTEVNHLQHPFNPLYIAYVFQMNKISFGNYDKHKKNDKNLPKSDLYPLEISDKTLRYNLVPSITNSLSLNIFLNTLLKASFSQIYVQCIYFSLDLSTSKCISYHLATIFITKITFNKGPTRVKPIKKCCLLGVMSESINWDMLQEQYFSDALYCEELSKACKIVDDPFACNLSKGWTDYHDQYDMDLADELKSSYVTPYELVNVIKINGGESSCRAVSYKSTPAKDHLLSRIENIKNVPPFIPSKSIIEMKKRAKEALWFMRGMMDECTHLKNFSVPIDTSLVISITAKTDGYVPRRGVSKLDEIWPGATVRYLDCGHVGAYIWYRNIFRDAIVEAFEKAKKKTPPLSPNIHQI